MQEKIGESAFSSIDIVGQCLVDKERTLAFKKAIEKIIKKDDRVIDLGTGSGIMAIFASKSGAKEVCGIEYDPFIAKIAKKNIEANSLNNVDIIISDAKNLSLDKQFNVVISEMLTTGMFDEIQVQAINNLHSKGLISTNAVFIPHRHDTYVTPVFINTNMFDVNIPMILHLWRWHKSWRNLRMKKMANECILSSLNLKIKNNETCEKQLSFTSRMNGKINGLYFRSESFLDDNIIIGDTEALNAPVFVPIDEIDVKKGDNISINISYIYGAGFPSLKVEVLS